MSFCSDEASLLPEGVFLEFNPHPRAERRSDHEYPVVRHLRDFLLASLSQGTQLNVMSQGTQLDARIASG